MGHLIGGGYLKVLRIICGRLGHDDNLNWVVTGSLGFALQGMPTLVHDIDLQTDRPGAYKIEEYFQAYVVRKVAFSRAERICSHFGALLLEGIKVEIMGNVQKRLGGGDWEAPVDLREHKRFVVMEGMRLPVLSLGYEYQAYKKLGRNERAQQIMKFINKTLREER